MTTVAYDALVSLQQRGYTSTFLETRLEYSEATNLLNQHIRPMVGAQRVYPTMVIPQASGRVGISHPPLGNFTPDLEYGPHGIRDVVVPDPGTKWICTDLDAVEAWIVSHRCQDQPDLEVKKKGWDIHTVTAIGMLKYPWPDFELTKEALRSSAGERWRERVGFTPRMRTLVKNCRYCLQYAHDERAMSQYAVEMEMDKKELWKYGRMYLDSKPWLLQWKRERWESAWRTKEARTAFGRRRRLLGNRLKVEKEGLNHEIQGTVADIMKMIQVQLSGIGCRMVLQRHDGWYSEVSEEWDNFPGYRRIVEQEWMIDNRPMNFTAEYEVIHG